MVGYECGEQEQSAVGVASQQSVVCVWSQHRGHWGCAVYRANLTVKLGLKFPKILACTYIYKTHSPAPLLSKYPPPSPPASLLLRCRSWCSASCTCCTCCTATATFTRACAHEPLCVRGMRSARENNFKNLLTTDKSYTIMNSTKQVK